MADVELTEGKKLRLMIVMATGGQLVTWTRPVHPPRLGVAHEDLLRILEARRKRLIDEIVSWHCERSDEVLNASFDGNGSAVEEAAKRWQIALRNQVRELLRVMPPEVAASFGAPDLMADFDHWSKAAYYRVSEVQWLSCGLEPTGKHLKKAFGEVSMSDTDSDAKLFVGKRRDLLMRQFGLGGNDAVVKPQKLQDWVVLIFTQN